MIAAIQAGGRSSRMGEDKAWLPIDGRPMIERVLTAAQQAADRLALVIHRVNPQLAQYEALAARWNAELWFDEHDHRGPLGGLETVLRRGRENDAALLLACDLPFVTAAFLQLLRTKHEAGRYDLTVPLDAAERPQMLAAIYARTCLPHVTAMLAADELQVRRLQTRVHTQPVRWAEYAHLAAADRLLLNLNTPEDLHQIHA